MAFPWMAAAAGLNIASSLMGGNKANLSVQSMVTPKGRELKKSIASSIDAFFPENIAGPLLGDAKKIVRSRQKMFQSSFGSPTGPNNVGSNRQIRGLLAESKMRMGEGVKGRMDLYGAEREFNLDRFGDMQNYINLKSGQPVLQGQRTLFKQETDQSRGADIGASVGSMAQMIALSKMMG